MRVRKESEYVAQQSLSIGFFNWFLTFSVRAGVCQYVHMLMFTFFCSSFIHLCVCVCVRMGVCVCMYVYMYICIYVCM